MTAPNSTGPWPRRRSRRFRLVTLSVAAGVLLGVAIALTFDLFGPRETGLASVDVLMLDRSPAQGSSYVIELESLRAGYPVILHVDRDGFPSILFPTGRLAQIGAGHRVRLPDPQGNATWWAGPEDAGTLLTVLAESPPADVDRLVELVERAAAKADDSEDALRNVERVVRRRLGEPLSVELIPGQGS